MKRRGCGGRLEPLAVEARCGVDWKEVFKHIDTYGMTPFAFLRSIVCGIPAAVWIRVNILMTHNAYKLNFVTFQSVDPADFLPLLNSRRNRRHLIPHDTFNAITLRKWLDNKLVVDASPGCRIRAILQLNNLVGWCGIQKTGDDYELAVVIDHSAWGIGHTVFNVLLEGADELGHDYVLLHLLKTRPLNRFLERKSLDVHECQLHGQMFRTYRLRVH